LLRSGWLVHNEPPIVTSYYLILPESHPENGLETGQQIPRNDNLKTEPEDDMVFVRMRAEEGRCARTL
jgi:hypothetical protein